MKAIVTKRHGLYRMSATAEGGNRCIIDRPDNATTEEEHHAAAAELCKRMNWPGYLIGGGLPDGQSYAWTFLPTQHPALMAIQDALTIMAERSGSGQWGAGLSEYDRCDVFSRLSKPFDASRQVQP